MRYTAAHLQADLAKTRGRWVAHKREQLDVHEIFITDQPLNEYRLSEQELQWHRELIAIAAQSSPREFLNWQGASQPPRADGCKSRGSGFHRWRGFRRRAGDL